MRTTNYTVHELAELSGVSTRTLRYYDQVGLLHPARQPENGYRLYGPAQVDRLQQILFYRALAVSLEEIQKILDAPNYQAQHVLEAQLQLLLKRQKETASLISNIQKTIDAMKGDRRMKDKEKFECFKKQMLDENEEKYGQEVRKKYGPEVCTQFNNRIAGMSSEEWDEKKALEERMLDCLRQAMAEKDPAGTKAQETCDLHRQWLCSMWPEGLYNKQAHFGMAQMYVADERFSSYYDTAAGTGAAEFLLQAMAVYTENA